MADTLPPPAREVIELRLPLDVIHASTLRTLVAAVSADAGFSIDEIDDLRLAASEVFTLLVGESGGGDGAVLSPNGGAPEQRARIEVMVDGRTITMIMGRDVGNDPIELDALGVTILGSIVDRFDNLDGVITLVKRGTEVPT